MNDLHEANRRHWEAQAAEWAKRQEADQVWRRCAKEPGLILDDRERHWLGDVAGKRVAVLGSGDNLVVFAMAGMGARVTSVDNAENQLAVARQRAAELGLAVEFLRADVSDLSALSNGTFDLVYTGGHIAIWVSDLRKFYADAARILKPGGRLILSEYHPFRRIWKGTTDRLEIEADYFHRGPYSYDGVGGLAHEFQWTVGDYISAVLTARCEIEAVEEFGTGEAPTIRGQATLVRQPGTRAGPTCAVAVQSGGNRLPLYFVSGFGGAILPFHRLAKELGTDQPLYVLDLNSLGDDPGETTLGAIAAQMLDDMRKIQPHGPYHLAGFSLGGKVVYEIAQQLHRVGEPVGLLALLDCAAPGFARLRSFPVRTVLHIRHALSFEWRQAVTYLVERFKMLKKYVGLATRIEPTVFKSKDIVDQSAAIVRTIESRTQPIYNAWLSYRPTFYPGRLTLIRAEVREYRPGVVDDDPRMGWGALVGDGVDVASLHCASRAARSRVSSASWGGRFHSSSGRNLSSRRRIAKATPPRSC